MRRILFRVDANAKIGWGHFYRSLALAEMLTSDFDICFAMSDPPEEAVMVLNEKDFQYLGLPSQDYITPAERNDEELLFDLSDHLKEIDVVLLDGYWFGPAYQEHLRKYPAKVVIIEDTGGGSYKADMVINHAPGVTSDSYKCDNNSVIFALGPDYALLRPSFLKVARESYSRKCGINRVLIAFGGSDIYNLTLDTAKWFLNHTDVSLQLVVGAGYQHFLSLKVLIDKAPDRIELGVNLNEQQMIMAMKSADLGVIPASGMLFECIACRLPTISGTYTTNQNRIFKGFLEYDAIFNGGDFSDLNEAWNGVSNERLADIQDQHSSLIDGRSGERISSLFHNLSGIQVEYSRKRKT